MQGGTLSVSISYSSSGLSTLEEQQNDKEMVNKFGQVGCFFLSGGGSVCDLELWFLLIVDEKKDSICSQV